MVNVNNLKNKTHVVHNHDKPCTALVLHRALLTHRDSFRGSFRGSVRGSFRMGAPPLAP